MAWCGGIPNDNGFVLGPWRIDQRQSIFLSTDRFFDTGGVDSRIYAQFEIYVAVDQTASETPMPLLNQKRYRL